jgi:hypothetical protein
VQGVTTHEETPPAIVSISDIHGYLAETRHALLTLRDHPECAPVVTADSDGRLHWAGENYVLVFNGDLIDRGPDNEGVLAMVGRLIEEAPSGRVRVTLGNHEWMVLLPDRYQFADWYSVAVATDQRRQYLQRIADGHVVAAYEGHTVTYAHAGAPDPYDVATVNESLIDAAASLRTHSERQPRQQSSHGCRPSTRPCWALVTAVSKGRVRVSSGCRTSISRQNRHHRSSAIRDTSNRRQTGTSTVKISCRTISARRGVKASLSRDRSR